MKETEREQIYNDYQKAYKEYISGPIFDKEYKEPKDKNLEKNPSSAKIGGNIFACIIKKKIEEILKGEDYYVSDNNSYIDGCFTEWDLLICRGSKEESEYNIYNPENVLCIIELKSGGLTGYSAKGKYKVSEFFNRVQNKLNKCGLNNIKYLYISLYDNEEKKIAISKELNNKNYYSYFVTTGSWSYDKFANENDTAADIDTEDTLEDIIKDIIEKTNN